MLVKMVMCIYYLLSLIAMRTKGRQHLSLPHQMWNLAHLLIPLACFFSSSIPIVWTWTTHGDHGTTDTSEPHFQRKKGNLLSEESLHPQ